MYGCGCIHVGGGVIAGVCSVHGSTLLKPELAGCTPHTAEVRQPLEVLPVRSEGFDGQPEVLAEIFNQDKINPAHYAKLSPEPITVIEAWELDFFLGNALKYIARAGRKPGESEVDDLKKAAWYLNRKVAQLKGNAGR